MNKEVICTSKAPKALGPYSQGIAVKNHETFYFSGQIALDPATGQLINGDVKKQTAQIFDNLNAILSSQGMTTENIVKTTVYLTDINDFAIVNEEYAHHFSCDPPARSCVQVAALPAGAAVEIEVIAYK
ncbi:MAG: RidA family protein [Clostridia bacterium]|nr:RidA family protein [Clostridia bacterium]